MKVVKQWEPLSQELECKSNYGVKPNHLHLPSISIKGVRPRDRKKGLGATHAQ